MTRTPDPTIPIQDHEGPVDPRPSWERIAYTWLEREVDGGHPVDPAAMAAEVSVAPGFAGDLVRVLRAQREHDPDLGELRARLVRDRITDAYLARELQGGQQLDPATLAGEVGTSATVARQWLHTVRAGQQTDRRLASLRVEPVSHGRPTAEQLQACRLPTPAAADPSASRQHRRVERWSASSSSTSRGRSPAVGRWTRPRWRVRSG
jgi:hypothetical protein